MKRHWFHIMLVVAEGPHHGAEIQRQVSDQTRGEIMLYPVTLYRSLDQLAARGLIEELPEPDVARHNERRRYYGITPEGRKALGAEAEALEAAAHKAQAVLKIGGAS